MFPFYIGSFSGTNINNNHSLHSVFQVSHISLCICKFSPHHNSIVFVSVKVTTHSILNVFQNQSNWKVNFCSTFQSFENIVHFFIEQTHVQGWHGKVEDPVSTILLFSSCPKLFARFQFFSQTSIVKSSHYILRMKIARCETHLCSMLSVLCWRRA